MNRPPGRYDDRRSLSPRTAAVGATVLVVALTLASYAAYQRWTRDRVQFTTLSSRVVSDTETTVTYQLRVPDGKAAVCRLNAVDADRAEVGTATVELTGAGRTETRTATVPTTSRAAAGQVLSCRLGN